MSEESVEPTKSPARARLIAIAAVAAIAVVALAGAGFVLLGEGDADEGAGAETAEHESVMEVASGEPAAPAPSQLGEILPLETFVVNINDRERDRYLKVKAELELATEVAGQEIRQRMPQLRDLILSLLASKSFEEIRTIEGKNFLREEILLRVNALLVQGQIRRVFFTEFVVQ